MVVTAVMRSWRKEQATLAPGGGAGAAAADVAKAEGWDLPESRRRGSLLGTTFPSCSFLPHSGRSQPRLCPSTPIFHPPTPLCLSVRSIWGWFSEPCLLFSAKAQSNPQAPKDTPCGVPPPEAAAPIWLVQSCWLFPDLSSNPPELPSKTQAWTPRFLGQNLSVTPHSSQWEIAARTPAVGPPRWGLLGDNTEGSSCLLSPAL